MSLIEVLEAKFGSVRQGGKVYYHIYIPVWIFKRYPQLEEIAQNHGVVKVAVSIPAKKDYTRSKFLKALKTKNKET